jgi:hypothetical protein
VAACFLEKSDVGKVLCPTRSSLVPHQLRQSQEGEVHSRSVKLNATPPRFFKVDAIDVRKNIDASWRQSKLVDIALDCQLIGAHAMGLERCAKRSERGANALGVRKFSSHEQIDIASRSGCAVDRQRVCSHDDELGAVLDEQFEDILEVFVHRVRTSRPGIVARSYVASGSPA